MTPDEIEAELATIAGKSITIDAHLPSATSTVPGAQVVALYRAIARGETDRERLAALVDAPSCSDRRADRAFQLLRSRGLIRFDKTTRTWRTP